MKRILTGILLFVAGLTGLLLTLCGGGFTLTSLGGSNSGILAISVPPFIAGLILLYNLPKWYRRWKGSAPPPE
jgi:hypothetical protein